MKRFATRSAFAAVWTLAQIRSAFADVDTAGILGGNGITENKIRTGDFTFADVPRVIMNVTNFALGFAGTISVVMIIYGAFKLSLGSIESDKDTAKKIITASLVGFVIAVSAWAIIKIVMTNI